jgi:S-adenosylmethionine:tRNA ribosyltransferase-isomerase
MHNLSDYEYTLPKKLIAQLPLSKRDDARLMILNRKNDAIEHRTFNEIIKYLSNDDILVINDTKVRKARLYGRRKSGGSVDCLLIRKLSTTNWEALIKSTAKLKQGEEILFEKDEHTVIGILSRKDKSNRWTIEFNTDDPYFFQLLGYTPLPPYIKRGKNSFHLDKIDGILYQTIYANEEGSIASPTAGIHFSNELFDEISRLGIQIARVTLHIGVGTFLPVKSNDIRQHTMEEEEYAISEESLALIKTAKANGKRIIAIGTSTVRVLETLPQTNYKLNGKTSLFIYPGFDFKMTNAMITNFHLPRGTPLIMTCAFAGRNRILQAYQKAIEIGYRFYSYGDAMLIV